MTSATEAESWSGLSLAQLGDRLDADNISRHHFGAVVQSLYGYRRDRYIDTLPVTVRRCLDTGLSSKVLRQQQSADGTVKWLLAFEDGASIETVLIPEPGRNTLCVSSQAGCAFGCSFCATGALGFRRHLTLAEIIEQVSVANAWLANQGNRVTNLVFMGMGEPLHNFDAVVNACEILCHDSALGLSKYRVTISTVGLVPEIYRLAGATNVSLALSLHAPDDATRTRLVPVARKYSIAQTLDAVSAYLDSLGDGRKVFIEYTLISGYNDSTRQAEQLAQLLKGLPCKINLIPWNPVAATSMITSDNITSFFHVLQARGHVVTVRQVRGSDIDAACGQLSLKGR